MIILTKKDNIEISNLAFKNLSNFIKFYTKRIQMNTNDFYQNINKTVAVLEFIKDDKEYIKFSFPQLDPRKNSKDFVKNYLNLTSFYEIFVKIFTSALENLDKNKNICGLIEILSQINNFLIKIKILNPEIVKKIVQFYSSLIYTIIHQNNLIEKVIIFILL